MKFLDADGKTCPPAAWLAECARADRVIGHTVIELGGAPLEVFARYSGISHHGGCAYELGVTGQAGNAEHKAFHGRHLLQKTRAEALAAFESVRSEIEKRRAELEGPAEGG